MKTSDRIMYAGLVLATSYFLTRFAVGILFNV